MNSVYFRIYESNYLSVLKGRMMLLLLLLLIMTIYDADDGDDDDGMDN